jgi:translocation and assembly module TamB
MKRWIKIICRLFLGLITILLILLLFTQTGAFRNILKNFVIRQAQNSLIDVEVSIDHLEGNLFREITVHNLTLIHHAKDTLISLEKARATYRLSGLLKKNLLIGSIQLKNPKIQLSQDDDGDWNVLNILPVPADTLPEENPKPFLKNLRIDMLSLENGNIIISNKQDLTFLPEKIRHLQIRTELFFSDDSLQATVKDLSFQTSSPDFTLKNSSFQWTRSSDKSIVGSFQFTSTHSFLTGLIQYDTLSVIPPNVLLKGDPVQLEEFRPFIPDLPVQILPDLILTLKSQQNQGSLDVKMIHGDQQITAHITAESFRPEVNYQADIAIQNINLADWLTAYSIQTDLDMRINLKGSGLDPQTLSATLTSNMDGSTIDGYPIEKSLFEIQKNSDHAQVNGNYTGIFGDISFTGTFSHIFSNPHYNLSLDMNHVNPSSVFPDIIPDSDLNLSLNLQGTGFNWRNSTIDLSLLGYKSRIANIDLDTVNVDITYQDSILTLHRGAVRNSMISADITGIAGLKGNTSLGYLFEIKDLDPLGKLTGAGPLSAEGTIRGDLSGTYPRLSLESTLNLKNIRYQTLSMDYISGPVSLGYDRDGLFGNVKLTGDTLTLNTITLDKVQWESQGNAQDFTNRLTAQSENIELLLEAGVLQDSVLSIDLNDLYFRFGPLEAETIHKEGKIILSDQVIEIDKISLQSGQGILKTEGKIRDHFKKNSSFSFNLESFDLSILDTLINLPYPIHGLLTASLGMKGTLYDPVIRLDAMVSPFRMDSLSFEKGDMHLKLMDTYLSSSFFIQKQEEESLAGSVKIPFMILPDSGKARIPGHQPVDIDMSIENVDLSFLETFSKQIGVAEGRLNAGIRIQNTLENPDISGDITLNKGRLTIPAVGLSYPQIRLNISLQDTVAILDEFYIQGGDGQLVFTGKTIFGKPLYSGVQNYILKAEGKNFKAAGSRDLYILTDLNAVIEGTPENANFNGTVTIPRGRINLESLQTYSTSTHYPDTPLLIQAQQQETDTSYRVYRRSKPTLFMNHLSGKLRIIIPRNTWIRSQSMNLEISGDVNLIQNGSDFELTGSISTLRGTYTFYGQKFSFKEGKVTFDGGTEINPLLNFTIDHRFRDAYRIQQTLSIKVNGRMATPEITFLLNDEEISEADAVSYLLFGRNSREITGSQQNEVRKQTESGLAKALIARQLGSQLTRELGDRLDLDVVEFAGGEDWKEASVYIGKYITDKLFVSYEKAFILGQTREIVPDKVSAEYELNRNIFIQATRGDEQSTGFDIIWKFTKR